MTTESSDDYSRTAIGFTAHAEMTRRAEPSPAQRGAASSGELDAALWVDFIVRELSGEACFRKMLFAEGFGAGVVDGISAYNHRRSVAAELEMLRAECRAARPGAGKNHAEGRRIGYEGVVNAMNKFAAGSAVRFRNVPDRHAFADRLAQRA